jgi:hypothetical protein
MAQDYEASEPIPRMTAVMAVWAILEGLEKDQGPKETRWTWTSAGTRRC